MTLGHAREYFQQIFSRVFNQDTKKTDLPPGWEINPSDLRHRAPIVALAAAGLALDAGRAPLVSRDVFLDSSILLQSSFFLSASLGLLGGSRRWQRQPWLVTAFGLAVGPLGFSGASWSLAQMATSNAWELKTLARSAAALLAIGPAMDEVLASLQHVRKSALIGRSPWRAFWGLSPRPRRRSEIRPLGGDQ